MKLKCTMIYLMLLSSTTLGSSVIPDDTNTQNDAPTFQSAPNYVASYNTSWQQNINDAYLNNKADSLCNAYVAQMLRAQAKLKPLMGTRYYRTAVRQELPGAPVGKHCVWGQHIQLSRALDEMGDTLTIIPQGARTSCAQFKHLMKQKYDTPEYASCIHDGVMYESDSTYNAALARHLTRRKITGDSPDSIRNIEITKFAQNHFCADSLDSGSILIVPRYRGSRNTFHAIMFLGRGRIENGKFIADENGRHIYIGHNRENIGDLFKTYDTSKVFAANTKKIARTEYARELQRIESMNRDELLDFLNAGHDMKMNTYSRDALLHMARDKYFNQPTPNDAALLAMNKLNQIQMAKNYTANKKQQRTM